MSMPRPISSSPSPRATPPSRLPGKPLRLLAGEPLVLHVARRALAAGAREVWVAADDERIAQALAGSGVRVAMTSPDHAVRHRSPGRMRAHRRLERRHDHRQPAG